jgi:prephenate dehydratase/chorismate mutase/prephenate dehydratase
MNLETIRKKIDQIDHEIFKLVNERIELGLRIKKFKDAVYDKERETQILENLKKYSRAYNVIRSEFVENLFTAIIRETRQSQKAQRTLIGFQGEHGAFGEVAGRYSDPSLVSIPCTEFVDVFEGVKKGDLDLGIVPVENSLGGAITQVNELLIENDLKIVGAVKLRINHCLLAFPETNYQEIRMVFSHPQALSQCREFLNRNKLEARPFYDTAGAAKMLSKERPKMSAVIASKPCAELYNLEVIKENIQDHHNNFTRFLILSKKEQKKSGNKYSIIFSTPHKAGTLFAVLKIFAEAGINLTRIESLPSRNDPGNYVFFLDFQSDNIQNEVEKILVKVKQKTVMVKYLGCYKEKVFE